MMEDQDLILEISTLGACQRDLPSHPDPATDGSSRVLPVSLGAGMLFPKTVLSGPSAQSLTKRPYSDVPSTQVHCTAIGAIRLGLLFLTLPTRVLTGQPGAPLPTRSLLPYLQL